MSVPATAVFVRIFIALSGVLSCFLSHIGCGEQGVSALAPAAVTAKAAAAAKQRRLSMAARPPTSPSSADLLALRHRASSSTLLLLDFDKTLTDYDCGACALFCVTDCQDLSQLSQPCILHLARPKDRCRQH